VSVPPATRRIEVSIAATINVLIFRRVAQLVRAPP
jgi:hypothetical protein